MPELSGPTRLEIGEDDGRIVATTPSLRLTITREPFTLAIDTADGTPILAPPSDAAERLTTLAASRRGDRANDPSYAPANRYLGLSYGVDGSMLGSYLSTGRARRWFPVASVRSWTKLSNGLRVETAAHDEMGSAAQLQVEFLDDATIRLRLTLDRLDGVVEMGLAMAADADEGFFGLGERFAQANHRGREVLNWAEDSPFDPRPGHDWTYWPVPFFLSSRGYGVFFDTTRRAVFRLASERDDAWSVSVDGTELDAVIFAGPDPLDVVRRFTALTGRPPLPQPWAFGVWKTTLSGADAVRDEARRLRDEDLGISAVWIYDLVELETNSGWGPAMGYPEGEYPDMSALIRDLHADGFKVLGYLNPQFIAGRPATEEGIAMGYFLKRRDGNPYLVPGVDPTIEGDARLGTIALYDPTHPDGVVWWQEMLRRLLVETGYDGWMHDFGEYVPRDAVAADGRTGEEVHNHYPALYHQTAAEICRVAKPDFSFFARSGYTGANQWAPAAWPGDQHADWTSDHGLPSAIPAGLSLGLCGVNTWGPDIGGFFDSYDGNHGSSSTELWIRWCQFGALTPLMRDHPGPRRLTTPDAVDLWTSEETVATWRRYARLHNALVPYLYAYAKHAHETGVPTMRHLVLRYPDDPEALRQDHQYLLGDELLVAPVIEPGTTTRRVYFPKGSWYSYWDDTIFTGPGYHEAPAPLDRIPLFVRGGSVLPLGAQPVTTLAGVSADDLLTDLELRVYPVGDDTATARPFVFHDGSEVRLDEMVNLLTITVGGAAPGRRHTVRLPADLNVTGMAAGGVSLEATNADQNTHPGWWRDPATGATWVHVPDGAVEFTVWHG